MSVVWALGDPGVGVLALALAQPPAEVADELVEGAQGTAASLRVSAASHPNRRTAIRYGSRRHPSDDHARPSARLNSQVRGHNRVLTRYKSRGCGCMITNMASRNDPQRATGPQR